MRGQLRGQKKDDKRRGRKSESHKAENQSANNIIGDQNTKSEEENLEEPDLRTNKDTEKAPVNQNFESAH